MLPAYHYHMEDGSHEPPSFSHWPVGSAILGFPSNARVLRGIYGRAAPRRVPSATYYVRPAAVAASPPLASFSHGPAPVWYLQDCNCNRTEPSRPCIARSPPGAAARTRRRRSRTSATRQIRPLAHLLGRIGSASTQYQPAPRAVLLVHAYAVQFSVERGGGFSRRSPRTAAARPRDLPQREKSFAGSDLGAAPWPDAAGSAPKAAPAPPHSPSSSSLLRCE